jgi:hypothetical protein
MGIHGLIAHIASPANKERLLNKKFRLISKQVFPYWALRIILQSIP